jgi:hypothetical protein
VGNLCIKGRFGWQFVKGAVKGMGVVAGHGNGGAGATRAAHGNGSAGAARSGSGKSNGRG